MLKIIDSPLSKGNSCQVQSFSLKVHQSSKQIPRHVLAVRHKLFFSLILNLPKLTPVLKAAPGAEAKSWLLHFSHPQLLENSVTFCLWQLGRTSAERRLTGQAPSAATSLEQAPQQAGRQRIVLQEKCRCFRRNAGRPKEWLMSFTVATVGSPKKAKLHHPQA